MKKFVLVRFNTDVCAFVNKTFDTKEDAHTEMEKQCNDLFEHTSFGDVYDTSAYLVEVNGTEYDWEIVEVEF